MPLLVINRRSTGDVDGILAVILLIVALKGSVQNQSHDQDLAKAWASGFRLSRETAYVPKPYSSRSLIIRCQHCRYIPRLCARAGSICISVKLVIASILVSHFRSLHLSGVLAALSLYIIFCHIVKRFHKKRGFNMSMSIARRQATIMPAPIGRRIRVCGVLLRNLVNFLSS